MEVPHDERDFLVWFREETESAWAQHSPRSLADYQSAGVGGSDWQSGTKWRALTDSEITNAEEKWNIQFPPDHRTFLRELGATDRSMEGAAYKGEHLESTQEAGFYDWRTDDTAIENALAWPFEGLFFDVEENDLWLDSWGPRPDSRKGRESTVRALVEAAPTLIPVFGHRYLLGQPLEAGNPVLSVYQADIIVYGGDLHSYLATEMAEMIGLDHEQTWEAAGEGVDEERIRSTPFWGEIMLDAR